MRLTGIHLGAVAIIVAAAIGLLAGGGAFAVASTKGNLSRSGGSTLTCCTLHYAVGSAHTVPAMSSGSAATKCPTGEYPIGGGPSSPNALSIQWSDPDRSSSSAKFPNEWTVGVFNSNSFATTIKAFVVCMPASSVSSTY